MKQFLPAGSERQQTRQARLAALAPAGPSQRFVDNRPEALAQRKLKETFHASPHMLAQRKLAAELNNSPHMVAQRKLHAFMNRPATQLQAAPEDEALQGKFEAVQRVEEDELLQGKFATAQRVEEEEPLQRQAAEEEALLQGKFKPVQKMALDEEEPVQGKFATTQLTTGHEEEPLQQKPNNTGLPDNLKSGIENLSGFSMDDVKVHYNSDKPAQLNAHAYAQGTDIHLASGQEQHLPHEAWHVVQQKQGRVKPTMQLQGINVNDNEELEKEADVMGNMALQTTGLERSESLEANVEMHNDNPVQRIAFYHRTTIEDADAMLGGGIIDPGKGKGEFGLGLYTVFSPAQAKHSRLIDPSVNGASKPAVPVSFLTTPVVQTFYANAPVQRAISEARAWVKVNKDKSGYPDGWSNMPRAAEITAYIEDKKQGWQSLKAELKKKTAPKKNTVTTTTTGGSNDAAINWQIRKQKLDNSVDIANDEIQKASGALQAFFEKLTSLPANIRVKINGLANAEGVKLGQEHSRLAFFSTSLLEYTKRELIIASKRTPEIQTAIVEDQNTKGLSVHISGNNSNANRLLQQQLGKKTLEKGYTDAIRPFHIKRKAATLEQTVKKKKPDDVKRLKIDTKHTVSDFKKGKKKDELVLKDGSGKSISKKECKENLVKAFAVSLHKETKVGPQNRQRKGARHFVKQQRNKKLKNVPVKVPANNRDIHAESAILESLKAQADQIITAVGGTKVACTACQAFYTKLKQEALLGDNTSFAWLSKSSINQLGFDADKVTEYLLEIKTILDSRINDLRFYEGKSGTFNDDDLTHEIDLDTDSEDEAAMKEVSTAASLIKAVDEVMTELFQ